MDSSSSPSVLIAGAGPTGLVLALSLLQNGVSVRIIDKLPEHKKGTRGAGITPRTLEIFDRLGVYATNKNAQVYTPFAMYNPDGVTVRNTLIMEAYTEPTPACPFMNGKLLGQAHSEQILRTALEKYSCFVELDTELVSFEQRAQDVIAHIVKRQNGQEISETVNYQFLVGTDGAHGVTRKALGLTFLGETRNAERIVIGDVYVEGLDVDHWHMWGDASTAIIVLRPTEFKGLFSMIIFGTNLPHAELAADREALLKLFYAQTKRSDVKFGEITWMTHYSPNIRMVDKFGEGRVFVAGDAAHVHSPTGGQGMNSGVQDAFNLAWKIALVQKGLAPLELLETFTEERLPVIAEMLTKTTVLLRQTFDRDSTNENKLGAWKRGRDLLQLGVNYRWSSIVVDEQSVIADEPKDPYNPSSDGKLHAGDRAPDAPGLVYCGAADKSTSLFKIFTPSSHTVLIFADTNEKYSPILTALASFPEETVCSVIVRTGIRSIDSPPSEGTADHILEDRKGHAHDAYTFSDGCFVAVVRPDGVVGAIVRGREGLIRYFEGIFSG